MGQSNRGQGQRGEIHHKAKLTEEQVRKIRDMRREGHRLAFLAQKFGIGLSTVAHITTGRTWTHIRSPT